MSIIDMQEYGTWNKFVIYQVQAKQDLATAIREEKQASEAVHGSGDNWQFGDLGHSVDLLGLRSFCSLKPVACCISFHLVSALCTISEKTRAPPPNHSLKR